MEAFFLNFSNPFFFFQAKDADLLLQNKAVYEDKNRLSQVIAVICVDLSMVPCFQYNFHVVC